jgi:hypothetical protein
MQGDGGGKDNRLAVLFGGPSDLTGRGDVNDEGAVGRPDLVVGGSGVIGHDRCGEKTSERKE